MAHSRSGVTHSRSGVAHRHSHTTAAVLPHNAPGMALVKSVLLRLAYHGGMAEEERDIISFVLSITSTLVNRSRNTIMLSSKSNNVG